MKGDIILVEEHHRAAAIRIVSHLLDAVQASARPYVITVAGESGSGKSEMAKAIKERFGEQSISAFVFQQDDYFVLPPKSNDRRRREDISWVGVEEVKIDLLDQHLEAARDRNASLSKPLVEYDEDRITEETVDLSSVQVVIAEGTYTTRLRNVDAHVFIARNRLDTLESRKRRAREAIEPFLEQVLEIEHEIISKQHEMADIVITREYDVVFPPDAG